MRTNVTQEIKQNVTFIGAANASQIAELIRDVTGTRRFASLTMIDQPNRDVINSINWQTVWQSVDHEAEDPMLPYRAILNKRQEAERTKTPVEDWITYLDPKRALGGNLSVAGRRFRSMDLHTAFREFEDQRFPGLIKTSLQNFVREMQRLSKLDGSKFNYIQDGGYILWEWQGAK
jgi:hypothetical protein